MDPSEEFSLFSKLIKSHKSLLKAYIELSKSMEQMVNQLEYLTKCQSLSSLVVEDLQQRIEELESHISKNKIK